MLNTKFLWYLLQTLNKDKYHNNFKRKIGFCFWWQHAIRWRSCLWDQINTFEEERLEHFASNIGVANCKIWEKEPIIWEIFQEIIPILLLRTY